MSEHLYGTGDRVRLIDRPPVLAEWRGKTGAVKDVGVNSIRVLLDCGVELSVDRSSLEPVPAPSPQQPAYKVGDRVRVLPVRQIFPQLHGQEGVICNIRPSTEMLPGLYDLELTAGNYLPRMRADELEPAPAQQVPAQRADPSNPTQERVHQCIESVLFDLRDLLISKNQAYGNAALDPVRIFSKADPIEQLNVRIDDKLSRLVRGQDAGEDVELDLLGYLVLKQVAKRLNKPTE